MGILIWGELLASRFCFCCLAFGLFKDFLGHFDIFVDEICDWNVWIYDGEHTHNILVMIHRWLWLCFALLLFKKWGGVRWDTETCPTSKVPSRALAVRRHPQLPQAERKSVAYEILTALFLISPNYLHIKELLQRWARVLARVSLGLVKKYCLLYLSDGDVGLWSKSGFLGCM